MADSQNRAGVSDYEAIVSRLRGVISARVIADERGGIIEIHVVADQSRSPKQMGRDIESALLSELGVRIDHRKVSIAQFKGANAPTVDEVRLKFIGIEYAVDRVSARARVSVGRGEDVFTGVASIPIGPELDQEQLVARAAVAAVEEFIRSSSAADGTVSLELGDFSHSNGYRRGAAWPVREAPPEKRPFVMVTVRVFGGKGEESLLGSALVREDPWRAAASAVLDAVNRRLPSLMA